MLPRFKPYPQKRQLRNVKIISVEPYGTGVSYRITFEWFNQLDFKETTFLLFNTNEPDDKKRLEKLCSYADVCDPLHLKGKLVRLAYYRDSFNGSSVPEKVGHIFENNFFRLTGEFKSNYFELI